MRFKKKKRIPIKCKKTCNKCEHGRYCDDLRKDCRDCEQYVEEYHCRCSDVYNGTECQYFKPIESEENNNDSEN